ncbi:hypothetical protein [Buchnera aphidicola]|uniref:hypothetical protein n=1 Tax=Buchnera aphidicola TaxID=9 RepID=UPI0021C9FACA|nr:hypothetical protein [Buchnera aphidicola]
MINANLKIYICNNSSICTIYYIKNGKFQTSICLSKTLFCDKYKNNILLKFGKFGVFLCVLTMHEKI